VRLIISDACRGLVEAAAEVFPTTQWQRCVVHFYRNVFSHVPNTKVADVARMLKAIHAQEDRKAAKAKAAEVVIRLKEMRLKSAAELVEQKVEETLTYYGYPAVHWRQIRTNNPLERIIREIRRRTRVVGAFPDGHSALMLVAPRPTSMPSDHQGKLPRLAFVVSVWPEPLPAPPEGGRMRSRERTESVRVRLGLKWTSPLLWLGSRRYCISTADARAEVTSC
jgi:transposase-like protein